MRNDEAATPNGTHNTTQLVMQETIDPTIPGHNAQEMADERTTTMNELTNPTHNAAQLVEEPELWRLSPFASHEHNAQVLDEMEAWLESGSSSVCWNAGLEDELDEMLVYIDERGWLSQGAHNTQAEWQEQLAMQDDMLSLSSDVQDRQHNAGVSGATLDDCDDWDDDDDEDDEFNPVHNAALLNEELPEICFDGRADGSSPAHNADGLPRTDVYIRELLTNPVHNAAQLATMLEQMVCEAPEDRPIDESLFDELHDAVDAGYGVMEGTVMQDNDDDERTTMTNDEMMAMTHEVTHELSALLDEPTETHLSDEMVRPSDAGWTSFADDPWTVARDLAHKNAQEMALTERPFNTDAGTGWWANDNSLTKETAFTSPSGFGQYAPNAGMTQEATCDSSDVDPIDDFAQASTVGTMLDANGEMLPMTDEMLAEARLAVGMRANGAWHDAPLESDFWQNDSGLYHGAPSSMTADEAIDEFGSHEVAGLGDAYFDATDAVMNGATYRANGPRTVVERDHEKLELQASDWLEAHSSCCTA